MDCDETPPTGQLWRLARAALDQQGVTIRRLRRCRAGLAGGAGP